MKVLIATGIYPPEIGGPATYAALLNQELPKRGIEVDIYPFRMVRTLPRIIRHIAYFWNVYKKSKRADLVFTQDPVSTGIPVVLASIFSRKKVVMRVAGDYAWEQASQRFGVKDSIDDFQKNKYGMTVEFLRKLQAFSVRRADVVITPSKYFSKLVAGWVNNEREVITIYNGIDLEAGHANEPKYPEKTVITAGRMVPWKGFDTLIDSLTILPEWKLLIAGDGPDRKRLEEIISQKKLNDRVTLLGQIPREKLFGYIHRSHVFALLSSFESFSLQLVEAMSIGLPVVACDIGNISEIVNDGHDGLLITPNDPIAFAEAVKKLEADPEFTEKIALQAKEKAGQFSVQKTLDELVLIFRKCSGRVPSQNL